MYTITINTNQEKAEAIFRFLKAFDIDFDIIDSHLSLEHRAELEKRLAYSLAHPEDGVTWEEMENTWADEKV